VRKSLDGGLGRMMDHAVVSNEEVNWSCTSSDDDQTGCESEIRREKEDVIKCAWLNNTLLDMVAQDEVNSTKIHVEIAVEVQGQEPLEFLLHTDANEEEPHPNDNARHILELQEELCRAQVRIEEPKKHIEDLQSELLVKDELIRAMQENINLHVWNHTAKTMICTILYKFLNCTNLNGMAFVHLEKIFYGIAY
jgi:hypothetical protein